MVQSLLHIAVCSIICSRIHLLPCKLTGPKSADVALPVQAIKPPTGIVYIAAKSYYFGVGGGTSSFKKLLKRDGMLEVHTVATIDHGDGNKREILKLNFPEHIIPYFL